MNPHSNFLLFDALLVGTGPALLAAADTYLSTAGRTARICMTNTVSAVRAEPSTGFVVRICEDGGTPVEFGCRALVIAPAEDQQSFWQQSLRELGLVTVSAEVARLLGSRCQMTIADTIFAHDLQAESSTTGVFLLPATPSSAITSEQLAELGRNAGRRLAEHTAAESRQSSRDRIIYDVIWSRERDRDPDPEFAELLSDAKKTFRDLSTVQLADLGCGRGRHALYAARQGVRAIAVDHSARATESLRADAEAAGLSLDVRTTDLADWTTRYEAKVDIVACICAIHHVSPDPQRIAGILREMAQLLAPDGYLLIALLTDINYGDHPAPAGRLMITEAAGRELLASALGHLELEYLHREFSHQDDIIHLDQDRGELTAGFYESVRLTALFRNRPS